MKGNMLIFAPFCLLLCWRLPVDAMTIPFNFTLGDTNQDIPLSMVEDSVDDMYLGCDDAMMEKVKNKYIEEEKYNSSFSGVWEKAKVCADKKFEQREDKALTKDHMQAICAYTGNDVYKVFNAAVRTNRSIYCSSFQFHSLHYLLTSAIQILNNNSHCHTTYRRATIRFTGKVNQIIRFGSFASSSKRTDLKHFGSETCFKIRTCSGAYLKKYSTYDDSEAEVLIPPYEMFNITKKSDGQGQFQGLEDCKRVFVLESAGVNSSLNCNLVHSGAPCASRAVTSAPISRVGIIIMIIIIIIIMMLVMIKMKHKRTTTLSLASCWAAVAQRVEQVVHQSEDLGFEHQRF